MIRILLCLFGITIVCMWFVAGDNKTNGYITDHDYIPSQCLERAKKNGIVTRLRICEIENLIERERAQFNERHRSCTDTGPEKNMYVCHTLALWERYESETREGTIKLYETIRATGSKGTFCSIEIFDYSFAQDTIRYIGEYKIPDDLCNDGWDKVYII